jgi:hypothetical protein
MDSRYKNRRVTILLVTLITLVVMTSCITVPLLAAFAIGFAIGGISAFVSVIYLLLKN